MRLVRLTCALAALALVACGGGDDGGGGGDGDGGNGTGGGGDYVTMTGLAPTNGPLPGGNKVVVMGSGFTRVNAAPNMFLIDGRVALAVSVLTNTELEVTMPPGTAAGPVDVTLFNNNGTVTLEGIYTYNPEPTVTALNPDNGFYTGGTMVTVTGTGFTALDAGRNKIFFGENEGTVVSVGSDTEMVVTTPPGDPISEVDVLVRNTNGTGSYSSFDYTSNGVITFGRESGLNRGALIHLGQDGSMLQLTASSMANRPMTAVRMGEDFYITDDSDTLHRRKADGTLELVGSLSNCSRSYGLTVHNGVLYATCKYNSDGQRFGSVNTTTGAFTPIGGNSTDFSYRSALASDGTTLYVVNQTEIAVVNPTTAVLSSRVSTDLGRFRSATFGRDGTLFALRIINGGGGKGGGGTPLVALVTVNPTTGVVSGIANFPINARGLATP